MKKYKEVLLISEDEGDKKILTDALKVVSPFSCTVSTDDAHCGLEYLTDLNKPFPDLIFLDRNMQAMDGKECRKKIRSLSYLGHIPIIMYTTSTLAIKARDFVANGEPRLEDNSSAFIMLCEDLKMVI